VDPARHEEGVHPGDGGAPVVADHVRPFDAERHGERDDVVDDGLHPVRLDLLRLAGVAEAAQVGRDHPEAALDQRRDLVAPQVGGVGEAVQQHDRGALPLVEIGDVHAVDVDELLVRHAVSLNNRSAKNSLKPNSGTSSGATMLSRPVTCAAKFLAISRRTRRLRSTAAGPNATCSLLMREAPKSSRSSRNCRSSTYGVKAAGDQSPEPSRISQTVLESRSAHDRPVPSTVSALPASSPMSTTPSASGGPSGTLDTDGHTDSG